MLHENIKALRRQKGLTQDQLAEILGVTAASVSKWETAQTQPDLLLLKDMAELFSVSVDALMDHTIPADRITSLWQQIEQLETEELWDEAAAMTEKLLRSYPNEETVLKKAEAFFYRLYIRTKDEHAMQMSIDLLGRMMALQDPNDTALRLERLSLLGNRYELLEQWDEAERYYKMSNVLGSNDTELASLRLRRGQAEDAAELLCGKLNRDLFGLFTTLVRLQESYEKLDCPEKIMALLQWGVDILWNTDSALQQSFALPGMIMAVHLAEIQLKQGLTDQAETSARRAMAFASGKVPQTGDFMADGTAQTLISSQTVSGEHRMAVLLATLPETLRRVLDA